MRRYHLLSGMMLGLTLIVSLVFIPRAEAQTGERCFPETGFCISGRIREFWEQNGGLPVFGFPITPLQEELIEGKPFKVQWFERNRLELHPENPRPYDVLLGRLGVDHLTSQGRDWFAFPKSAPQSGCRFFPETGHNVCGAFLSRWRADGLELDGRPGKTVAENLALFGLPLSGVIEETLSDGKTYQVQWFERARFEMHPANPPQYRVLLGLLGKEVRSLAAQPASPAAVVTGDAVALREGPGPEYVEIGRLGQSSEIDVIGQFNNCAWLKVRHRAQPLTGWVLADAQQVTLQKQCSTIPPGTFRPMTGVLQPGQQSDARGELTVENGTERDGIVILTIGGAPQMSAYVRSRNSLTMRGIPDGLYQVYFSTGSEWNGREFTVNASYRRFRDMLRFETRVSGDTITYTTWRITLHPVAGGTAPTDNVGRDNFPGVGR
ncbi:MAG: SH3 domain-containing protein [Roseiflexaceae bacterium]|nr:SH3 domain-containing protein [Roseiflexaceae bacterium]